jgi:hypothetical protein
LLINARGDLHFGHHQQEVLLGRFKLAGLTAIEQEALKLIALEVLIVSLIPLMSCIIMRMHTSPEDALADDREMLDAGRDQLICRIDRQCS